MDRLGVVIIGAAGAADLAARVDRVKAAVAASTEATISGPVITAA
jgi:hypothetical protein